MAGRSLPKWLNRGVESNRPQQRGRRFEFSQAHAVSVILCLAMIFTAERPITAHHVRHVCERFNEGLRVEYKSTFDASVRNQLPKIVSSFANSQGGVLVVGINALNGVPQPPFEGFAPPPREEFALTVENICLQNIHPPLIPRSQVVQSDVPDHVFLVIEVEESGEAPNAIENSKRVYVRTGSAANPYDLAEVELIIDLLKRRRDPLERRDSLLKFAEKRSSQTVRHDQPFVQISVCPTFPRSALCSSQEVWDFLRATQLNPATGLVDPNSLKRIPDGAAGLVYTSANLQHAPAKYVEIGRYGLLFAAVQFRAIPWNDIGDQSQQLYFADLFQTLLRLTVLAERFYFANGHRGSLLMNISLYHVQGLAMRFVTPGIFGDNPEDFRCYTDLVLAERLVTVDQIQSQRSNVLTEILSDLTWAFWQSNLDHPTAQLRALVERG